MTFERLRQLIFVFSLCFFLCGTRLVAQVDTSVITGLIRDTSDAIVPAAAVVITNAATGVEVHVLTGNEGIFTSPPLRPGAYQVAVSKEGFEKTTTSLQLRLNERASADLHLHPQSTSQEVTVTEQLGLISTDSNAVGVSHGLQEVETVPINQRNAVRILELTPGVVPANTQAQSTGISNYRGTAGGNINGLPLALTNYLIDGINNNENHTGQTLVIYPLIESIAEMRVINSGADAQFGRTAGGVVNVILKSGSRDFHGTAFEYFRNAVFDARNYFATTGNKPRFNQNQFGFAISGPISIPHLFGQRRDKTFFFADYEGNRRRQSLVNISTLPTQAMLNGDFSGLSAIIYDPLTGAPFPGNKIDPTRFNKVGKNFAALFPANNSLAANNYIYIPVRSFNTDDADLRIDHYINSSNWVTLRLSGGNLNGVEPGSLPAPAVGAGPSTPGPQSQPHVQGSLAYTYLFSSRTLNEFRLGYSRLAQISTNFNAGTTMAQDLGVPGVNVAGQPYTLGNISQLALTGYSSLGDGGAAPGNVTTDNNQVSDIVTFDRGRHLIKLGTEVLRRRYNVFQPLYSRGLITFAPYYTANPTTLAGGNAIADLLLGAPQSMTIGIQNGSVGLRRWETSDFVQDSWKVTSHLTLNYGLRWDLYLHNPWTEVNNRESNFLPSTGQLVNVATPELPSPSGTDTAFTNVAPRFGFAYAPTRTTAVHGSYGIYFAPIYLYLAQGLAYNAPFLGNVTYNNDRTNFLAAHRMDQGFVRGTSFSAVGANLNAISQHLPTPYTSLFSVGLQQQFPAKVVLSVDYVGDKSTHVALQRNINAPLPGPGTTASRRPFPIYGDITQLSTNSYANYNGLQVTLERQASHGLQMRTSYTYSHCLDVAELQNPLNINDSYASCNYDLRHRWVTITSYILPIGRGRAILRNVNVFTDAFVGGWSLNGVLNVYSGLPFTPTWAASTLNATGVTQRPNLVPDCNPNLPSSQRSSTRWFDTKCYVAPPLYSYGNAGRTSLIGPGTHTLDLSLFKSFPLVASGEKTLQFRAEAFNLTNTPQLNNPGATIGTASAGVISSAGSAPTFSRTQRQMQFALRLSF